MKPSKRAAARAAFPFTIPILTGFLVLGIAYGIYMKSLGFSPLAPILISLFVFAGSMQFVAGSVLTQAFAPVSAFFLTLMVNARHVFYGISMLEKYRGLGKKTFPTIFWMCDETFSVNVSAEIPEGITRGGFTSLCPCLTTATGSPAPFWGRCWGSLSPLTPPGWTLP